MPLGMVACGGPSSVPDTWFDAILRKRPPLKVSATLPPRNPLLHTCHFTRAGWVDAGAHIVDNPGRGVSQEQK